MEATQTTTKRRTEASACLANFVTNAAVFQAVCSSSTGTLRSSRLYNLDATTIVLGSADGQRIRVLVNPQIAVGLCLHLAFVTFDHRNSNGPLGKELTQSLADKRETISASRPW